MNIITIDKKVGLLADEYAKNLFQSRRSNFVTPIDKLKQYKLKLKVRKEKSYIDYIDKIISEYDNILKATPNDITKLIAAFSTLLSPNAVKKITSISKKKMFYECIVEALRYEDVREIEFLKYLEQLGIKTCIYCNAQLTIVSKYNYYDTNTKKYQSRLSAKLELDHYYPKSKYPFLATSFFNLYPVCGNCNRAKSANPIKYEAYSSNGRAQPFYFFLTEDSIINYWNTGDRNDLKVFFDSTTGDHKLRNEYNKTFNIQGIYDTQKDIVEEIAHKVKVYTKEFKDDLVHQFPQLFPTTDMLDRLILGNYTKENEVHMRPLAKFTQDIAKQLGLIPK